MNIILFGPPGAGKGTQANYLVNCYNLYKISTGDLLRKEIENKTSLGIKIQSIISQGSFVSDNIINDLIINILSNNKLNNRLIFDGYPRNLTQAKNLDTFIKDNNLKISCVLSLKVEPDILVKRILGRQICSKCGSIFNVFFSPSNSQNHACDPSFLQKRSDDNEVTVKSRFQTYIKETLPILKYYQNQKLLYEIDGMRDISIIYKEIRGIIQPLEA